MTKKEALVVFKKKSLTNSVSMNEELPLNVPFPEEFLAFMQKVKGKMDEIKTLVAQEVPILKMALRSLPNDLSTTFPVSNDSYCHGLDIAVQLPGIRSC